jgi:hypothetical protein
MFGWGIAGMQVPMDGGITPMDPHGRTNIHVQPKKGARVFNDTCDLTGLSLLLSLTRKYL